MGPVVKTAMGPAAKTAVFLKGFDFGTTEQQVRAHCARIGKVRSVELKGGPKGGSALVTFASEAQATQAQAQLQDSMIDGNERYISAQLKAAPSAGGQSAAKPPKGSAGRAAAAGYGAEPPWGKGARAAGYGKGGAPVVAAGKGAGGGMWIWQPAGAPMPALPWGKGGSAPVDSALSTSTEVNVRNFDFETTEEQVRKHFGSVGKVVSVELKGSKGGSAVVTFNNPAQAQRAVERLHDSVVKGTTRQISVKLKGPAQAAAAAAKKQTPALGKFGKQQAAKAKQQQKDEAPGKKKRKAPAAEDIAKRVFVKGFDRDTSAETVLDHCRAAGTIVAHEILGKPGRITALILTYSTEDEASEAVATLQQTVIEGSDRPLELKMDEGPKEKEEKEPSAKRRKVASNGDSKAGGKKEKGPSGPDLPRERLTVDPVKGKVLSFKGKSGWLLLAEKFEHADMKKNRGNKIWCHSQDVAAGELTKDDEVQFHLYKDAGGIGAEDIVAVI